MKEKRVPENEGAEEKFCLMEKSTAKSLYKRSYSFPCFLDEEYLTFHYQKESFLDSFGRTLTYKFVTHFR